MRREVCNLVGLVKTEQSLPRPANAPRQNPKGSACLALMLRYHLFMGNNHTTVLPCLNTKQAAANLTLKGQQTLIYSKHFSVFLIFVLPV